MEDEDLEYQAERSVPDVRIDFRMRNNNILRRMEENEIESVADLCRLMGLKSQGPVGNLITMKRQARNKDGTWCAAATKLASFFGCIEEDLFSETQQRQSIARGTRIFAEVASEELLRLSGSEQALLPDELFARRQLAQQISKVLNSLPPRMEYIVRLRFGLGGVEEETL